MEEEIYKRNKLYKAVKAKGYIAELSTQDAGTLKRWVAGLVRKEQKQISESVIVYFLDKVGTDMEISRESWRKYSVMHWRGIRSRRKILMLSV